MDGARVESLPLAVPRIARPMNFCCVGTNPPATMAGLQRRRRQCALFAAVGAVYIFRDQIGPAAMRRLAARGSDHLPAFGVAVPAAGPQPHCGIGTPATAFSPSDAAELDAELGPKVLQLLHPRLRFAGANRTVPDLSPGSVAFSAPTSASGAPTCLLLAPDAPGWARGALAVGGVEAFSRAALVDSLHALGPGGVSGLVPLAAAACFVQEGGDVLPVTLHNIVQYGVALSNSRGPSSTGPGTAAGAAGAAGPGEEPFGSPQSAGSRGDAEAAAPPRWQPEAAATAAAAVVKCLTACIQRSPGHAHALATANAPLCLAEVRSDARCKKRT